MNIRYRADIDGLRALAVLVVLAYHLKVSLFSGGFVGVDVFFVISGFLITGIVIRSIDDGKFSFLDFFKKRIKRIVPNVLVVSTATVVAGWFLLLPNDYASLISSYLYTSLYAANFYFWNATGAYFASSSDEMPLLHMWSLAVEEQFYFIWPAVLFFIFRLTRAKHLGLLAIAMAAASFAASEIIARSDAGFAYYMLHTRSGGLLLGAGLAILHRDYKSAREFNSVTAVIAGTLLILWTAISVDSSSVFPGINSAIPSVGAFLVIAGGTGFKRNIASKIYSFKLVVWIGLISFSMYLWHWPVIAYCNYLGVELTPFIQTSIFICVTVLSVLSLLLLENPTRKSKIGFLLSLTVINIGFVAIALLLSVISSRTNGFEGRFDGKSLNVGKLDLSYPGIDNGWCHVSAAGVNGIKFTEKLANCFIGEKSSSRQGLFIGDSNAGHYSPFVDDLARKAGFKVRQLSTSSCWPTRVEKGIGENADVCLNFRKIINKEIPKKKYDFIVVGNNWERDNRAYSYRTEDFISLFRFYAQNAKKVIILAQMPEWMSNPAACYQRGQCNASSQFVVNKKMADSTAALNKAASKFSNVEVIDPSGYLIRDGNYTPFAMGSLMYKDTGHLTIKGMKWVSFRYSKENPNPFK